MFSMRHPHHFVTSPDLHPPSLLSLPLPQQHSPSLHVSGPGPVLWDPSASPSLPGCAFAMVAAALPLLRGRDVALATAVSDLVARTASYLLEPGTTVNAFDDDDHNNYFYNRDKNKDERRSKGDAGQWRDTHVEEEEEEEEEEGVNRGGDKGCCFDEDVDVGVGIKRLQHLVNRIEQVKRIVTTLPCSFV